MVEVVVRVVFAYLLGSINGSLVLGRWRGVDIRTQGSGNAGGTNALRTQGPVFALGVILIDVGKSWLAVRLVPTLGPGLMASAEASSVSWLAAGCGFAAVVGHVYPIFHGFRGGKGVATLLGTVLALSPALLLGVLGVWLAMMLIWGYVGLGSMVAAGALPALAWLFARAGWVDPQALMPLVVFGLVCAPFVVWTHRSNVARLRAGTEPRARRLWLLGRWRS